jgi:hypothetical protein
VSPMDVYKVAGCSGAIFPFRLVYNLDPATWSDSLVQPDAVSAASACDPANITTNSCGSHTERHSQGRGSSISHLIVDFSRAPRQIGLVVAPLVNTKYLLMQACHLAWL